ncbi:MAG: SH3 domain-containing protein [Lachnospiraceae bacterium]|nr:SH3 domain-containing protein [Lachnospiraceae bacterium]
MENRKIFKEKRREMIFAAILAAALICAVGVPHIMGGRSVAAEEVEFEDGLASLSAGDVAGTETVSGSDAENAEAEMIDGEYVEAEVIDGEYTGASDDMGAVEEALIAGLPRAELAIADVNGYINIRSGPGTDNAIVGKLYDGGIARVLETAGENDDWFYIASGNVEGYAKAEFFLYGEDAAQVLDDYVTCYAEVQADRLNVREAPDITARKLGSVDTGRQFEVLEDCGEWIKIQYTGREAGYVSAEYVTLTEEFIYAKSLEEERAEREAAKAAAAQAAAVTAQTSSSTAGNTANETTYTPPEITDYDSADDLRAAIVEYAMQYLGNSYIHGGNSLAGGTDCSGFTCFIYADFGYSISRTPGGQLSDAGRSIDYSEIKPGDIICYTSNGGKSCTHVGLYIGDGQIIHSANSRKGVIISNADYSIIMGVKNVID